MTTTNNRASNNRANPTSDANVGAAKSTDSRTAPRSTASKTTIARSSFARTATGWSAAAAGRVRDNVASWTRSRRQDDSDSLSLRSLDIRLSVDPDRTSCIIGIIGTVDASNVRDLSRALRSLRSYRFVSIDITTATFSHPVAQLRFDQLSEELEIAGITVIVSGARDDMES